MKVLVEVAIASLLFIYDNQCPAEQETDWELEKLLPHEDCDKFYKCTYGEPVEQDCPSDLYFNLDTLQCDWPENVDCSGRNVPGVTSTTSAPTTTTTTTTPTTISTTTLASTTTTTAPSPDPDFLANGCPVDSHTHWLLPHETDCNLFYYCVRGEKLLRDCPDTLHFNPEIQVCDWPRSAGCITSFNKHLSGRLEMMAR